MSTRGRILVFILIALACVAVGALALRRAGDGGAAAADTPTPPVQGPAPGTIVYVARGGRRHSPADRVSVARVQAPGDPVSAYGFGCDRLAFDAGVGVCLRLSAEVPPRTLMQVFTADGTRSATVRLPGVPTRTRLAPGGRLAGVTTFVTGHSYARPGAFSTLTTIVDVRDLKRVGALEDFAVSRDGRPFRREDFNFWGVTFADDDAFYATLATQGTTYLVRGSVAARTLTVVRENVECPSLSPDGSRIAFKKRVGGPGTWRFHVLDLATMEETPLAERDSVDDQIAWLDERTVLYRKGADVWRMPADGGGSPARFMSGADSPQVVHENVP